VDKRTHSKEEEHTYILHDELFPTFTHFFKQLVSMQDEDSLDFSSLKCNKTLLLS